MYFSVTVPSHDQQKKKSFIKKINTSFLCITSLGTFLKDKKVVQKKFKSFPIKRSAKHLPQLYAMVILTLQLRFFQVLGYSI